MKGKAIAISAFAGAAALFAWQSISQMVIPWHRATMTEVADTTAGVIPAIRQVAPANGVYFSRHGALIAVRIAPGNSDLTSMAVMGPMLAKQAALNLAVVTALCLLVGFLADRRPIRVAAATALAGFAMIGAQEISQSIWYGFTSLWALVNIVDQTISFFLAGLIVGALMRRFGDDAVILPEGQGYRISGKRTTIAK
jgi:hypothetical protein